MHQYTMTSEIYSWSQISGRFRAWHMVGMFVACTSCSKWIFISSTGYFERTCKIKNQNRKKRTVKFRNMTQQKTAWFVQYKDNREIIVVKRIICYLNPFTTTTKFFISILKWRKINAKIDTEVLNGTAVDLLNWR